MYVPPVGYIPTKEKEMEGLRIPYSQRPYYFNPAIEPSKWQVSDPEALLLVWLINRPSEVKGFNQALHQLSSDDFRFDDTASTFAVTMGILDSIGAFTSEVNAPLPKNAVYPQLIDSCTQGNNAHMICVIKKLVAADDQSVTSNAVVTSWIDMILHRGGWDRLQAISRHLTYVSTCPINFDLTKILAQTMVSLDEIAKRIVLDFSDSSQELVDISIKCLRDIEARASNNEPRRGILTGFDELDQMLGGLKAGKLYILAARPSVGKTAFALNVMENIASSHDITKPILFFSLEMVHEELGERTLSTCMQASTSDIEYHRLSPEQTKQGIERLRNMFYTSCNKDGSKNVCCVMVDDNAELTPNLLAAKVRNLADNYGGVSLIVIDYIQLMLSDNTMSFGGNRNQELANISRQLKLMAKEYACPVLALSQLNRQIENRENQTPMLSDLRDSGAIEQDADAIMFLSKPQSNKKEQCEIEARILDLAKNRSGRTGTIDLNFRGAWTLFTETSADRKGSYLLNPDASKAK